MKTLSFCKLTAEVRCFKELSIYESVFVSSGTECVYLRLEPNEYFAQVVFADKDGIWRLPYSVLEFISEPKIQYQTKSGNYILNLAQGKAVLTRV